MLPKPGLMAGAAVFAAFVMMPSDASAQANPFMPSAGASRADVEKIVEERVKALEARLAKNAPKADTPATPNGPGAPGAPGMPATPGAPGAPGAGPLNPGAPGVAPNGITPYGPGAAAPVAPPADPVDEARSGGVRFLGCINGVPKFVKASGERVSFTQAQLNRAVKAGYLPACR